MPRSTFYSENKKKKIRRKNTYAGSLSSAERENLYGVGRVATSKPPRVSKDEALEWAMDALDSASANSASAGGDFDIENTSWWMDKLYMFFAENKRDSSPAYAAVRKRFEDLVKFRGVKRSDLSNYPKIRNSILNEVIQNPIYYVNPENGQHKKANLLGLVMSLKLNEIMKFNLRFGDFADWIRDESGAEGWIEESTWERKDSLVIDRMHQRGDNRAFVEAENALQDELVKKNPDMKTIASIRDFLGITEHRSSTPAVHDDSIEVSDAEKITALRKHMQDFDPQCQDWYLIDYADYIQESYPDTWIMKIFYDSKIPKISLETIKDVGRGGLPLRDYLTLAPQPFDYSLLTPGAGSFSMITPETPPDVTSRLPLLLVAPRVSKRRKPARQLPSSGKVHEMPVPMEMSSGYSFIEKLSGPKITKTRHEKELSMSAAEDVFSKVFGSPARKRNSLFGKENDPDLNPRRRKKKVDIADSGMLFEDPDYANEISTQRDKAIRIVSGKIMDGTSVSQLSKKDRAVYSRFGSAIDTAVMRVARKYVQTGKAMQRSVREIYNKYDKTSDMFKE